MGMTLAILFGAFLAGAVVWILWLLIRLDNAEADLELLRKRRKDDARHL